MVAEAVQSCTPAKAGFHTSTVAPAMPRPVAASVTLPEREGTRVGVGLGVAVLVGVGVGVLVGVGVGALVGVNVAVLVGVGVAVLVGAGVAVLVGGDVAVCADIGAGVDMGVA